MTYYIAKLAITALLVLLISETSKKSSLVGGILASLPIVSYLAMIWLYADTKSVEKVANLSTSIFWLVLPSLSLFVLLPVLLKRYINFYLSLGIATFIIVGTYFIMVFVLKKTGISL